MLSEARDPALAGGWADTYKLIDAQLDELRRRAGQSAAGRRRAGDIQRATESALEVFDKWGDDRGDGPTAQKWIEWEPFCEAMANHAAERSISVGGKEEWIHALLLLHACNRAVTTSMDRKSLILHRDMITEYDERAREGTGGSA